MHKGRDGVYMVGELVASYNEVDGHWYRATVTKCHEEQLEVRLCYTLFPLCVWEGVLFRSSTSRKCLLPS